MTPGHLDNYIQDGPMDSDRNDDTTVRVYCGICGDEHEICAGEYREHFDELGAGVWHCGACLEREWSETDNVMSDDVSRYEMFPDGVPNASALRDKGKDE